MRSEYPFYTEKSPAPSASELREGIALLLDTHGNRTVYPSTDHSPEFTFTTSTGTLKFQDTTSQLTFKSSIDSSGRGDVGFMIEYPNDVYESFDICDKDTNKTPVAILRRPNPDRETTESDNKNAANLLLDTWNNLNDKN